MNPGLRLVATWIDLACGCSESNGGSWIVTTSCDEHIGLIPESVSRTTWPLSATGVDYGPFVPPRDVGAPHALRIDIRWKGVPATFVAPTTGTSLM